MPAVSWCRASLAAIALTAGVVVVVFGAALAIRSFRAV
jgi:hypothetical protein